MVKHGIPFQIPSLERIMTYSEAKTEKCPFYKPFMGFPEGLSQDIRDDLQKQGMEAINTYVQKPLSCLHSFLKDVCLKL